MEDDEMKVSQAQIDSLLSGLGSEPDRFFIIEEQRIKEIADAEKIKDWYRIKEILDRLNFATDVKYQNERLTIFIEEIKKRI